MEINLNNDLYIESGNTIGVQDIPQNEGNTVLGVVSGATICRACTLSAITSSAVYGITHSVSADLDIGGPTGGTVIYTFVFTGTPTTASVYARANGTTGGTYSDLGKVNTTGFTYSKSAMSYCISAYGYTSQTGRATVNKLTLTTTISYTLTKTSASSPYTFTFTGSPTSVGIGYRGLGTTNGYIWTTAKTISTVVYSAIQYTISATGYDTQTGTSTVLRATSSQTASYQLERSTSVKPWTFTFTGTPTNVGIGWQRYVIDGTAFTWTTAKTIYPSYSAIYYTISADGYSSQSSLAYANQSTSSKTISYTLEEAATTYYGVRFLISPTAATPTIFYGASLGSVTANSTYANVATKSSNYWIFNIQWQYPNMYYQIEAPRYTTITGSTLTLADDIVVKTIILTQTGYTYTYSINVSPSAATFEYGEDDSCSESDFYSETVNNNGASKTYVIKTNYSPLYYDAFLDGYDEETGSITGNSGKTVTKVISLPKTKYEYWILVEDKKTGSAISGATIGKVVVGFSGETVTNSYGVAYIYAYDTIPQVSVSAPYRGTQLITMSSTLTPRGTYGTFNGTSVRITNVFDIPYYYKVCAKLLEQGSGYNSIISGVSFSCSGASTSVSVLTTDVGTGMAIFTSEDSTIWVQASKSGHQITSSSINVTDTTLSSNYAMITLYMYYDYYRYLSVSQIMMSNSKGQYGCCCGVGITHNKSGNQEDKIVSGGTLIDLEASDKGSSVTLEFFHRGADVIEEQITIPVRTVTSPIFTTGLIIPFTGSNKTLTANDLESISLDEEEGWANGGSINYSLRGVKDDDASAVGTGWGRYRGEFLTAVTATDQVVLESDVDFYMFLPDE
jgi:hypothetical protein